MSRNSAGTYSLPTTGNPVVSGTTISSTQENAFRADIATELSNSLDRQGRGAMLAPLQAADGSSSAPGITYGSESTSGLYRAGAGDHRVMVLATEVLKLTTATVTSAIAWVLGSLTLNGNLTMAGSNPASTTGFSNILTKKNVPKAWVTFLTDGVGGVSMLDGFNVASVAINSTNYVRVTFATAMGNANYSVAACPVGGNITAGPRLQSGTASKSVALCDIAAYLSGAAVNLSTGAVEISVLFFGQQ